METVNPIGCSMEKQMEAVRQLQILLGGAKGHLVSATDLPRPPLRPIDPVNDTQVPSPELLAQMEARGPTWDKALEADEPESDLDHDIEGDGGDDVRREED